MAGTLTVDTIQSDSSYASTLNVASKMNFAAGMQIGGQDTTFGGMRNRVINGAMVIDQRNVGASVTPTADGTYTLDRWRCGLTVSSKYSVQQNAGSVTPPTGFTNYLGITSLSAYSVLTADTFYLAQSIEGFNVADLGWGTANAKTVTLSFWVRSSLTGTFGGSFSNSAGNRSYPFTYSISVANTWEQKSVTVVGDTSGTWQTTNGSGLSANFNLGSGSTFSGTAGAWASALYLAPTGATSVVGTNGATFYITGVQLEKGSAASAFENRQYGTELALCQRYFQSQTGPGYLPALCFSTNRVLSGVAYTGPMRATPTFSVTSNSFTFYLAGAAWNSTVIAATPNATGFITLDVTVTASAGASGVGTLGTYTLSAEL